MTHYRTTTERERRNAMLADFFLGIACGIGLAAAVVVWWTT